MIIMFFLKNIEMLLLNDYDAVIIGHSQLLKYINMLLLNRKVFFKNERFSRVKIHQYVTVKPEGIFQERTIFSC